MNSKKIIICYIVALSLFVSILPVHAKTLFSKIEKTESTYTPPSIAKKEIPTTNSAPFSFTTSPDTHAWLYWGPTHTMLDFVILPFFGLYKFFEWIGECLGIVSTPEPKELAPDTADYYATKKASVAIPALVTIFEDTKRSTQERTHAIFIIHERSNEALEAIAPLMRLVKNYKNENKDVVKQTIWALGYFKNSSIVTLLMNIIKESKDEKLISHCIWSLYQMKEHARDAAKLLYSLYTNTKSSLIIRSAAENALENIVPKEFATACENKSRTLLPAKKVTDKEDTQPTIPAKKIQQEQKTIKKQKSTKQKEPTKVQKKQLHQITPTDKKTPSDIQSKKTVPPTIQDYLGQMNNTKLSEKKRLIAIEQLIAQKAFPKDKNSILEELLKSEEHGIGEKAFELYMKLNLSEKKLITYFESILPYVEDPVKIEIAKFFEKCGEKAKEAIAIMIIQLKYTNNDTYKALLVNALAAMGPSLVKQKHQIRNEEKSILEIFNQQLSFSSGLTKVALYKQLLKLQGFTYELDRNLSFSLSSPDPEERITAMWVYRQVPPDKYNVVFLMHDLTNNLNSPNKKVRENALLTLNYLGTKASRAKDDGLLRYISTETDLILRLKAIETLVTITKLNEDETDMMVTTYIMPIVRKEKDKATCIKALSVLQSDPFLFSALPQKTTLEELLKITTNSTLRDAFTKTIETLTQNAHLRTDKGELEKIIFTSTYNPLLRKLIVNFLISSDTNYKNESDRLANYIAIAMTKNFPYHRTTFVQKYYKASIRGEFDTWIKQIEDTTEHSASLKKFFSLVCSLLENKKLDSKYKHKILTFLTTRLEKEKIHIRMSSKNGENAIYSSTLPFNCYIDHTQMRKEFLLALNKLTIDDTSYKKYCDHFNKNEKIIYETVLITVNKHKPVEIKRRIFSNYTVYGKYFNKEELLLAVLYAQGDAHTNLVKCLETTIAYDNNKDHEKFAYYLKKILERLSRESG